MENPGGWGVQIKESSMGGRGVWIFSGTTQSWGEPECLIVKMPMIRRKIKGMLGMTGPLIPKPLKIRRGNISG